MSKGRARARNRKRPAKQLELQPTDHWPSSFKPSHSGDTGRLLLACQLEQLSLAVDRDSISRNASRSAWHRLVRRRTFNPVAAHHGRLHRCRDPRTDPLCISPELFDRRYQNDRSQISKFPHDYQFRSVSAPRSRQTAGRPLASLFQFRSNRW